MMVFFKQWLYDRRAPKLIAIGVLVFGLLLLPVLLTDRQSLIEEAEAEPILNYAPTVRESRWSDVPLPPEVAVYSDTSAMEDLGDLDRAAEQIFGFPKILKAFETKGGSYERMMSIEETENADDYRRFFEDKMKTQKELLVNAGWVSKEDCTIAYNTARASLAYCLYEKKTDKESSDLLHIAFYSRNVFLHAFYRLSVPTNIE